jgi:Flp pilus assembly secretin CpaC
VVGQALLSLCLVLPGPALAAAAESTPSLDSDSATLLEPSASSGVSLAVEASASEVVAWQLLAGELRVVPVEGLVRVAIGNPEVADVTITSESELLLHAKQPGTTNLIIWDARGRRRTNVTIVEQTSEHLVDQLERLIAQLKRLIAQLGLEGVQVRQEGERLFLTGEVDTEDQRERLSQLSETYPNVTNVVGVTPTPPTPPAPPPAMIRLGVQVIELNRTYTEKLGVKWSGAIGFTEQPFAVRAGAGSTTDSVVDTLADSMTKQLGEPFRIGTLFRQGFSATVNFLVSRGKAIL